MILAAFEELMTIFSYFKYLIQAILFIIQITLLLAS